MKVVNTLQQAVDELIQEIPERFAIEMFAKKCSDQGIELTARERRRFARVLTGNGDPKEFRLDWWRSLRWWDRRTFHIEFTPEDLDKFQSRVTDAFEHGLPEIMRTASAETAKSMLADLRSRWASESRAQQREMAHFTGRLHKQWHVPLGRLKMLLTIVRETGGVFSSHLAQSADASAREHLIEVLGRLHARACQIAGEIVCLLEGGFADGAMARWRTLHEVVVVAFFVAEHGEDLAERYMLHEAVESKRAAEEYQKHHEALGYDPIPEDEMNAIRQARDEMIARFGSDFEGRTEYGWARKHLTLKNKKDPSFRDIEQAVGVDHLRPYFRLACHNVHANPKGAFYRLGLLSEADVLLAGPSNAGLEDPGQCTALSLSQICAAHFSAITHPTIDHIVLLRIVEDLVPEIAQSFVEVHRHMLEEEQQSAGAEEPG